MLGQSMSALGSHRNTDSVPFGTPIVNIGKLIGMGRPMQRTAFGQRMFEARTEAGLSQTAVCKALGISQSTLSDAERVAAGSSLTVRFAQLYKVSAQWLADGAGPKRRDAAVVVAAEPWPFYRITAAQWGELTERERGALEDAAVAKLRELRAEHQAAKPAGLRGKPPARAA